MIKQSLCYCLAVILLVITSGCTKKTPKHRLNPLDCTALKTSHHGITVQVTYISPQQFKKIYPRGLGKYVLLGQNESYMGKKARANKRRIRMLQGTITNNTKKSVYISRRSVSLPTIPPHKAYQQNTFLRNFSFAWFGLWGSLTVLSTYFLIFVPAFLIPTIVGCLFSLPAATVGTVEHLKEFERKDFVCVTMLSNKAHEIEPGECFSWLMMIQHTKYEPEFAITCTDENDVKYSFEVSMQSKEKASCPL